MPVPVGYRWLINNDRPMLLHLVRPTEQKALCGKSVRDHWIEPKYTQRTKCRPCWLKRAEETRNG